MIPEASEILNRSQDVVDSTWSYTKPVFDENDADIKFDFSELEQNCKLDKDLWQIEYFQDEEVK